MTDEIVSGSSEKPLSQIDFALKATRLALNLFAIMEYLDLSDDDVFPYLDAARNEVLSVDLFSIGNDDLLRQLTDEGYRLLAAIRCLHS